MTNADIQETINSLSTLTDTTSRQTVTALRLLTKEILHTDNYVTEEDRLNQAVARLVKFWSRQSTPIYSVYIKIISKLKNKMYSFSEVEKLTEELSCLTFSIFLNKVRQQSWAKYIAYSDLKSIYNLRHLDDD